MPELVTKRLLLRPFTPADAPDVLAAMMDRDIARWIPLLPHPYGAPEAKSFVEMQSGPKQNALAVTQAGTLIGCMTNVIELGYWFVKSAWGKGYATEAAQAVLADHFARSGVRLLSGYILENARSSRVLEKLGFAPTEQVVRHSDLLGQNVTVQRMELDRTAWQAHT